MDFDICFIQDKKTWDQFINSQDGSFLQSWEWGSLQEKLGREVKRLAILDQTTQKPLLLSSIIKHHLPFGKSYFYSPRGPITEKPEIISKLFLDEVRKIADKGMIFLRIEPISKNNKIFPDKLKLSGLQEVQPVQPKATLILDLTKTKEDLLKAMEYETRYAIRLAQRRNVKIIKPEGLSEKKGAFEEFWRLLQETAKFHHFKIYPKDYYWQVLSSNDNFQSEIFLADLNKTIIGTNIIVFLGKTATYLYSASLKGYGKFNAPSLLLWEAILEAKKKGCQNFDFWGINSSISSRSSRWAGFTAFKKSFGGQEVNYVGTWDYILNKKFYFLYKIAKNLIS